MTFTNLIYLYVFFLNSIFLVIFNFPKKNTFKFSIIASIKIQNIIMVKSIGKLKYYPMIWSESSLTMEKNESNSDDG